MAKRKRKVEIKQIEPVKKQKKMPVPYRSAFLASLITIIAGLAAQYAIAFIIFKSLPEMIPTSWIGIGTPTQTMPSWIVFIAFPGAELVLLIIALFSPKDSAGKRVMEWGKAISLICLAVLFTILQGSAFYL